MADPGRGRDERSNRRPRPAFNPSLLASPFYDGATAYGGASASASASESPSRTRAQRRPHVLPPPQNSSDSSAPVSRTARRIWELLINISSPISDARRAGANHQPGPKPPTSRLQPLRVPSMAALVTLKRNNRRIQSTQAAITASLSSSAPYDSHPPTPVSNPTPHSNKIRHRLTGRNRDRDVQHEFDMPSPVRLPNITLDMTGATLPNFAAPATLKRTLTQQSNGPTFKFAAPIAADVDEVPRKRFHFSDPIDLTDPKAKASEPSSYKSRVNEAADDAKRKRSDGDDVRSETPIKKKHNECKIPTFSWNGDASEAKKSDPPPKVDPVPSLASFVKKQQSQWECDSCLARNDNAKDKCACCEAAKPGAAVKPPTPAVVLPPIAKPETKLAAAAPSGFSNFMQKQQAQWECSCCLTRNNTDKTKCVCCEAVKPGTQSEAVKATTFNFGSPQTSTFKFGIDKANIPTSTTNTTSSDKSPDKNKSSSIPTTGFVFGIPPTAATTDNSDAIKPGGIKFGLLNNNISSDSDKKTQPPLVPSMTFGMKKEESPVSTPPAGFSFGFKPAAKVESPKAAETPIKPVFTFTSPQLNKSPMPQNNGTKEKIESVVPTNAKTIVQNEPKPVQIPETASSSIVVPASKDMQPPPFTFGSSPAKPPVAAFGTAPKFNFGSPASSSVPKSDADTPFKPTGMFSFGNKTTSPSVVAADPASPATPKSLFSMPATNGTTTLFPNTSTSIQPSPKIAPSEVTPLKDTKTIINSPFSTPMSSLTEKPKDQPTAAPVFNFSGLSSTPNAVPNLFQSTAAPAAPVFSFGSTVSKPEQPTPSLFGAPPTNSNNNIFGSQVLSNDINKTTSNASFKPTTTPISTFAPITGNIFGSSVSNTGPQNPSTNLFNTQSTDNKPANIFGSPINLTNLNQPQQIGSLFNRPVASFNSTFNAGNIFGSSLANNAAPQQSTNLFGAQPTNKPATAPEPSVNAFMSKAQSPSTNIFGSPLPTGAPSISTGGIFGSHPAVPTPLGASIPFGEAAQVSQPAQNVPFKFGDNNPNQLPISGFGQVAGAGGSAPVFSFGSPSTQAPVNSQFNFSMGAPTPQLPTVPGATPTVGARLYKRAVRRNVPR